MKENERKRVYEEIGMLYIEAKLLREIITTQGESLKQLQEEYNKLKEVQDVSQLGGMDKVLEGIAGMVSAAGSDEGAGGVVEK